MRVFGVVGWKNSGKTHLMVRLVDEITSRGFSVSTIKHAHHTLQFRTLDSEGRELRAPGVREAMFVSPARWSVVKEMPDETDEPLADLLARLRPVDLVLIEGYKLEAHPKLEVHRIERRRDLIARQDARIVAVAADIRPQDLALPVFDLDDTAAIADFILDFVGLSRAAGTPTATGAA